MYYEKMKENRRTLGMTMDKRDALIGTTQGVYTFDGEKFSSFEIPEGR
jgi:hypothetical protein